MTPRLSCLMLQCSSVTGKLLSVSRHFLCTADNFSFESQRYRSHPFSLTLYVNGKQDCRLSVCCEYKHKPGARLGGKSGHFSIVSVKGSSPCYRFVDTSA